MPTTFALRTNVRKSDGRDPQGGRTLGRATTGGGAGHTARLARLDVDKPRLSRGSDWGAERDAGVALVVHGFHAFTELGESAGVGQVLVCLAGDVGAPEPRV